ncbi:MAG: SbcC/MukB-like Walker B domain-containing protein [Anaerolineae bacterium]
MLGLPLEFEPDNAQAGFRLQRLEVFNWGTFNRQVWAIGPGGQTALLTGANGSGKSTLVDALLTLLVPNQRRAYNQAGGDGRKRERDERSYVLGAYGKVKAEDSYAARTQHLRTRNDYSVLLAVFGNSGYREQVTLAQVFWFQQDQVQKFFAIAGRALSIAADFSQFGTPTDLKRRLRQAGVEVYDEFSKYSQAFRRRFGLRSDKALDLFNQTVSIKEIGGLNEFVRTHMLERTDVQARIADLRRNHESLTQAHAAIQKARRQLDLLRPLLADADHLDATQATLRRLEECIEVVPAFFAEHKRVLLDKAIAEAQRNLAETQERSRSLKETLDSLDRQRLDLVVALRQDETGQRLQSLQREIERLDEHILRKQGLANQYTALAQSLGLPGYDDAAAFHKSAEAARAALPTLAQELQALTDDRDARKLAQGRLREDCATLDNEIRSLRQRTTQIPREDLALRERLLDALDLAADAMPFVGELLRVRAAESAWEGAIERLLRGFGRQMLVPEAHYRRVSDYVNATHLNGRLVFLRVGERRLLPASRDLDPDLLIHKLDIKPDTPFHDWLRAELIEGFPYVCCDSLERFRREPRALTREGLIKSGHTRHEKDDRFALRDRKRYILGWDNRQKVAALEAELQALTHQLHKADAAIADNDRRQSALRDRQRRLEDLLRFDEFSALDWRPDAESRRRYQEEMRRLEQTSDRLRQLQIELTTLEQAVADTGREREAAQRRVALLERDVAEFGAERDRCAAILAACGADRLAALAPTIVGYVHESLTLDNVADAEARASQALRQAADRERRRESQITNSLLTRMLTYKGEFPAETVDVDTSVNGVGEFRRMWERIERDDLPQHERRFKNLLNEKVIHDISLFQSALEDQVDRIRESIAALNQSLHGINYTPATYIRLSAEPTRDVEVREFRQTLRACLPDVGRTRTAEDNEISFQRIQALIQRFDAEERWTTKVTDVRHWLDFSASERFRETDEEKGYYSDSSGKSGGQKAKLAYTILASAIAYQYGLELDEARSRSFRLVVVDEAFSKSDETNARYAMELFKKLALQLIVVTPLDKTHVVEPYIATCHFVYNTVEENDSRVIDITRDEYVRQKAAFLDGRVEP